MADRHALLSSSRLFVLSADPGAPSGEADVRCVACMHVSHEEQGRCAEGALEGPTAGDAVHLCFGVGGADGALDKSVMQAEAHRVRNRPDGGSTLEWTLDGVRCGTLETRRANAITATDEKGRRRTVWLHNGLPREDTGWTDPPESAPPRVPHVSVVFPHVTFNFFGQAKAGWPGALDVRALCDEFCVPPPARRPPAADVAPDPAALQHAFDAHASAMDRWLSTLAGAPSAGPCVDELAAALGELHRACAAAGASPASCARLADTHRAHAASAAVSLLAARPDPPPAPPANVALAPALLRLCAAHAAWAYADAFARLA